jgi:hypothetical protein
MNPSLRRVSATWVLKRSDRHLVRTIHSGSAAAQVELNYTRFTFSAHFVLHDFAISSSQRQPHDCTTVGSSEQHFGKFRWHSGAFFWCKIRSHHVVAAHRFDWSALNSIEQVEIALAQQQQHATNRARDLTPAGRPDLDPFLLVASQMTSLSESIADLLGSKHPVSENV